MTKCEAPAVRLTPRLAAAAALVRKDRIICDVGTDHALLPCYLFSKGARRLIASDVRKGPLDAARENIKKYHAESGIELVLSDGLKNIAYAEDIVIAGMGGELISRILSECIFFNADTRLILQPMSRAEVLRRTLYKIGFELLSEQTVCEDGRYYVIMYAAYTGKIKEIDELFAYTGKLEDKEYLKRLADTLERAADGCANSEPERSARLKALLEQIRKV